MKKIILSFAVIGLLFSTPSAAQQNQIDPDQLKKSIEVMFSAMLDVLSSPQMATAMAKFYKSFYDSLIEQGFSEADAMKIVTSTPLPIGNK